MRHGKGLVTSRGDLVAALLLAAVVALVPLWSATVPPLLDYHNHLARQYILSRIDSSPWLAQWYITAWHASPYLVFDGLVQALAAFVPVDIAGRLFLSLTLLLLAVAPIALNMAIIGRVTPVALLGLLFVHNETVTLGFVNYLFGIGFALCAAALWIRLRLGSMSMRLVLMPAVCALVFFSHLLGFVLYLLTIGAYELGRYVDGTPRPDGTRVWRFDRQQWINLLSLGVQGALPLSIFAMFGPSTDIVSSNTHGGLERKLGLLWGMFDYLIPPYLWKLDRAIQWVLPLALLTLLLKGRLRIDPGMRWPLAALALLFFVMPMELFSGWGADHRLLPALGLMLVGSLRPVESEGARVRWPVARWAFVGASLLVLVRAGAVATDWRKSDAVYEPYLRAFEVVPDGSRLFFAYGHDRGKSIGRTPVYHMPTLVLSRRDVYVPYMFASSGGGFTLQYRPEVEGWQKLSRGPVLLNAAAPDWATIVDHFDYFMFSGEAHFAVPVPAELERVFEEDGLSVYSRRREAP